MPAAHTGGRDEEDAEARVREEAEDGQQKVEDSGALWVETSVLEAEAEAVG